MINNVPIKTIYKALFDLLKTAQLPATIGAKQLAGPPVTYTWQRTSRRTIDWDNVAASDQPFMLLHGGPIEAEQRSVFQLPVFTLRAYCWVFFRFDTAVVDDATTADDTVQDIFDAINTVLQGPIFGERQTLAGTIYHAFTEGCMFEAAIEDNQVLMFIPIVMKSGV